MFWLRNKKAIFLLRTQLSRAVRRNSHHLLMGTATLTISIFYQKELYEPWILMQVSSKSVQKWGSKGILRIQYGQHLAAILII